MESTIVQFSGHSTFLKGHHIVDVADALEDAAKADYPHKFWFFDSQESSNHVAVDARKVIALYKHVEDDSNS